MDRTGSWSLRECKQRRAQHYKAEHSASDGCFPAVPSWKRPQGSVSPTGSRRGRCWPSGLHPCELGAFLVKMGGNSAAVGLVWDKMGSRRPLLVRAGVAEHRGHRVSVTRNLYVCPRVCTCRARDMELSRPSAHFISRHTVAEAGAGALSLTVRTSKPRLNPEALLGHMVS